jgi:hypothetical protein
VRSLRQALGRLFDKLRMTAREVWVSMTRMRTKATSISERRLQGQRDMRPGEPHVVGEYRRSEMLKFYPIRERFPH